MRILLVMCCLAAGPVLADGWSLDLAHSELVVKVWKTGAAAGLAHDHVIRASRVTGTASLADAANPRSLSLQLNVDVASLVPDEPETRKRYGVTGPAVPEPVARVLARSLQKDPEARHPTATAFYEDLITAFGTDRTDASQRNLPKTVEDARPPVHVPESTRKSLILPVVVGGVLLVIIGLLAWRIF